jgi:ABC-2 type transport system permease protein
VSRGSFSSVARAVGWRNVHNWFTNPALLIPSLMFPLFFFTAFAGGLSNVGNVPGFDFPAGYTAFQFVFVLLQAAAFGGVFTGFGIASDFENGFARRLLLAAPNRYGIIAGYALAAAARTTFVAALIFVVGLLTGMQVGGDAVDIVALILLAYLVSLSATLFAAGVAMRLRTMQAGPLMQMPVFLVLFLAPVYVPLGLLSGWVHAVATVNPITPIIETGRDFISGTPGPIALAYAIGAALVVLFAWWAARGLRSAEAAGGG